MMFTKNTVSPYHHTLLSAKTSYKILFSKVKSFYLKLGSYFNAYGPFYINFLYKFQVLADKLYLNLLWK